MQYEEGNPFVFKTNNSNIHFQFVHFISILDMHILSLLCLHWGHNDDNKDIFTFTLVEHIRFECVLS